MEWLYIAILVLVVGPGLYLYIYMIKKYSLRFKQGSEFVAEQLAQANFHVSREIGRFAKFRGSASFYLYVDDVNKKWVIASPFDKKIDKIRNFNELLDFGFFDNDANRVFDKIMRGVDGIASGITTTVGAVGGFLIGGALGRPLTGAVVGGLGNNRFFDLMSGRKAEGKTGEYGFIIKTTDCDAKTPALVFNFLSVTGHAKGKVQPRQDRTDKDYIQNIGIIMEMGTVFEYILRVNSGKITS